MTDMQIRENLKKFRMKTNPKAPFQVFKDSDLDALIAAKPKTLADLARIKGFPKDGARVEKYGEAIVEFFKNGCKVENLASF